MMGNHAIKYFKNVSVEASLNIQINEERKLRENEKRVEWVRVIFGGCFNIYSTSTVIKENRRI